MKSALSKASTKSRPCARVAIAVLLALTSACATTAALANVIDKEPAEKEHAQAQAQVAIEYLRKKDHRQAMEVATKLVKTFPQDPIGYTIQGTVHMSMAEFPAARKSFERALALNKDYEAALMNLGELDLLQKNFAGARSNFQRVVSADSKSVVAMVALAKVEAAEGKEADSVAWLERAKLARPDTNMARVLLANYHLERGNYPRASAELADALRVQPNNARLLELLGQAQTGENEKAEAISTYTKLVAVQPRSADAHRRLGFAKLTAGDIKGASVSFSKSLELKPNNVEALSGMAAAYSRGGQPGEAMKVAKRVQSIEPARGYTLEGDLLADQSQYAQAAAAYDKALDSKPTSTLAVKRHSALSKAGNLSEADAQLVKWIAEHPRDVVASLYLAQEYTRRGENKRAIDEYQRVLKNDPKNMLALNNLANLYRREGDSRAIAVAEDAYRAHPDAAGTADTLGWMLIEQGSIARGLELLQRAATLSPFNTEIRYHLAAALAKAGDKEKAKRELEDLLANTRSFPQREAAQALLRQL